MILAYMPDLMMRSKLDVACAHYKIPHTVVINLKDFDKALESSVPAIALIDLDANPEETLQMIDHSKKAGTKRTIAFCSHVLTDLIKQGSEAGADQVSSNSTMTSSIPGLVSELAFNKK